MNYQKMRDASMNNQLNQNRAFNYQRQPFSHIPSVRGVKRNSQRVMCRFTWGILEDGGSSWGEKRKKMRVKRHVTVM
jgi:hypothetical protein